MTAGSLSTLFSWAALICTLAGAISTGVALHYRNVSSKEKDLEIASIGLEAAKSNAEAAKAHERIADLSTQAEQLRKDAAEAKAREKTAELKLEELRKKLQPRQLNEGAFLDPLKNLPPQRYKILYVRDTTDALELSLQIMSALEKLKWIPAAYPAPIEKEDSILPPDILFDVGSAISVGGQPRGISIALRNIDDENPVAKSLLQAIANNFGQGNAGRNETLPPNFVLFVIAPRF